MMNGSNPLDAVVAALREVYTEEGVTLFLFSPNRALGGERPAEMVARGEGAKVLRYVEMLAAGSF